MKRRIQLTLKVSGPIAVKVTGPAVLFAVLGIIMLLL
jgi:hypothetical protein